MNLAEITDPQLVRLSIPSSKRMTRGDGYLPFGYDGRTLRIT